MADTSIDKVELPQQKAHNITYPPLSLSTEDAPLLDPVSNAANSKHILVLGAGVSGLMVAWILLDKGYRVTILADDWAWTKDFEKSRMTSQVAGALWEFPPGGCGLTEIESPGSGWATLEHYREWALQSYEFYKQFSRVSNSYEKNGWSFGLKITDLHQFFYKDLSKDINADEFDPDDINEEFLKLQAIRWAEADGRIEGLKIYNKDQLKSRFEKTINTTFRGHDLQSAYTHQAPIIDTDKAMAYLTALVTAKGANVETRQLKGKIKDFGKQLLEDYDAHAIVNATGLSAKTLADDDDVYPVRGAVRRVENTRRGHFRHLNDAYLVPAQKNRLGHPSKTIFIVPRSDDVLYVGSIIQPNNYERTLNIESSEVQLMWDRAGDFMPSLRDASFVPEYPFAQGLRPFTKRNVKVRADEDAEFPLVHNYGHGGSGWTLGIGTARCAVYILEQLLGKTEVPLEQTMESLKLHVLTLGQISQEVQKIYNSIDGYVVPAGGLSATAKKDLERQFEALKERVKIYRNIAQAASKSIMKLEVKLGHALQDDSLVNDLKGALSSVETHGRIANFGSFTGLKDDEYNELRAEIVNLQGTTTNTNNCLNDLLSAMRNFDATKNSEYRNAVKGKAREVNVEIYGAPDEV